MKEDVESLNKRIQNLEKDNETLHNELARESTNLPFDKDSFDSLLKRVNSLESLTTTLSETQEVLKQDFDTVKADTKQNKTSLAELNTELFGTQKDYKQFESSGLNEIGAGDSTLQNLAKEYNLNQADYEAITKKVDVEKGRIPSIESRLDSVLKYFQS